MIYIDMSDSDVQAIDDKNQENNPDTSSSSGSSNYGGFISGMISVAVVTVIFAILGANFIYLSRLPEKYMDEVFPINIKDYFCKDDQEKTVEMTGGRKRTGKMRGGGSPTDCKYNPSGANIDILKMFGLDGKACGWPYSIYNDKGVNKGDLSWANYRNWFASSSAQTYITIRTLLRKVFEKSSIFSSFSQTLHGFVGVLFFALATSFAGPVAFVVNMFSGFADANNGPIWSLISLFLPFWTMWITCFANSIIWSLSIIWILLVVPWILDGPEVANIIACNSGFLAFFFLTGVLVTATTSLSDNESMWFTVGYVLIVLKMLFDFITSSHNKSE
jgi:hypothetical protein